MSESESRHYWEGYEAALRDLMEALVDEDRYVLETVQRVVDDLLDDAGIGDLGGGINYG